MRRYQLGAHTKTDLKVHLIWIPKYGKRGLTGHVALRVRDVLRQSALGHELEIITGHVARDHVHRFIHYQPHQDVSKIVQGLKGISSRVMRQEFAHLKKQFWGRHFWARGYLAVSSGNITDEILTAVCNWMCPLPERRRPACLEKRPRWSRSQVSLESKPL